MDPLWQKMQDIGYLAGSRAYLLKETGSTNTTALEMAKNGVPNGTLVIAESQSHGRGRLGKTWLSPPGSGLYFSLIIRPRLELQEMPKLTLAAGVAVCRALNVYCAVKPMIKWPNDILLADKKCGGILTEAELAGHQSPIAVIGIGLNISPPLQAFPADLRLRATSLQNHVALPVIRGELLAVLVSELKEIVTRLEENDFPAILAQWRRRDATKGRQTTWLATSGQVVKGLSLGPDAEGRLHIKDQEGRIHEILSGDIQLAGLRKPQSAS